MFDYMDEILIKISHIEQLKMIHFYSLDNISDDVIGLAVYFKDKDMLNLCSFDSCFDLLFSKTLEVYSSLSDEEKAAILADSNTRSILESASSVKISDKIGEYAALITQKKKEKAAFIGPQGYIDSFLTGPVTFVICSVLSILSIENEPLPYKNGWFGRGMIKHLIKGKEVVFPYVYSKRDSGYYHAMINNFLSPLNTLNIDIRYSADCVRITYSDALNDLSGYYSYAFADDYQSLIVKHSVTQHGKEIHFSTDSIKAFENPDLSKKYMIDRFANLLPDYHGNFTCFQLPWDQCILADVIPLDNTNTDYTRNQISYCFVSKTDLTILNFFENKQKVNSKSKFNLYSSRMIYQVYTDLSRDSMNIHYDNAGYMSSGIYKKTLCNNTYQINC